MKKLLVAFLYVIGATRFAAWWHRKQVVILCYHSITGRTNNSLHDGPNLHVCRDRFAAQLDFLQRRYRVIPLREYLRARKEGGALPHYSVILTFDDGYRNFLTIAAPLLAERSMPATVFLITDVMHEDCLLESACRCHSNDDTALLSWADARALDQDQWIEFGSHTLSHLSLTDIPPEATERQLHDSLAALRSNVKRAVPALAYPNGAYSASVIRQVRSVGYACALTIDPGSNDMEMDLFTLRRQTILGSDNWPMFTGRVSCLTSWLARGRDVVLQMARALRPTNP